MSEQPACVLNMHLLTIKGMERNPCFRAKIITCTQETAVPQSHFKQRKEISTS